MRYGGGEEGWHKVPQTKGNEHKGLQELLQGPKMMMKISCLAYTANSDEP